MTKIIGWTLYFLFLAGVVLTGWDQPLKVHFISTTPLGAAVPTSGQPDSGSGNWMHDNRRWDNAPRVTPPPPKVSAINQAGH
jgi:hypothetical protein